MAKQQGSNPITGTFNGFSYYYNKAHGYLVRRTGAPTKQRLKKGSEFDITRRNNNEFGRASHYGKLLRTGFRRITKHCKDGSMNIRLARRLREIMMMDKESVFGNRDLRKDNLIALQHFEWDCESLSRKYFDLPIETRHSSGCLEVTTGISLDRKPKGADAWKLFSVAVTVDFITDKVKTYEQESDVYEFEKGDFAESFTHYVSEDCVLFHGMCLVWLVYDATIDDYVPLKREHVNVGFVRYVG